MYKLTPLKFTWTRSISSLLQSPNRWHENSNSEIYSFEFNLKLICISEFFKNWNCTSIFGKYNFSFLKNSQGQTNSKLNKKNYVWLLINNINIKKIHVGEVAEDIFWSHFLAFTKTFFKDSLQTFCHCFTWYHWLRKFPFVFQPIIIQNYHV